MIAILAVVLLLTPLWVVLWMLYAARCVARGHVPYAVWAVTVLGEWIVRGIDWLTDRLLP